jgi:rod shape-determining protein MreD
VRWIAFLALAYVAMGLQLGLGPFIAYRGAAPNLMLLVAVFVAVNAPRGTAMIACFMLGLIQDLGTLQVFGLFALCYGLVSIIITNTQQVVYKDHPLTHFSLTLGAGLLTAAVIVAQGWLHPPALLGDAKIAEKPFHISATIELTRVIYTAILAPFVLGLMKRTKPMFGFASDRRKGRAWG